MADELVSYLEGQLPKYLEDLRAMTSVDCGSYTKAGVDKIGEMVKQMVEEMGGEVKVYPQENFGNDVVGIVRGKGKGRIVLLCHMDTVFDEGTCAARPTTIEGNIIKGPGVCDMKGGLLNAIYAVKALQNTGFDNFGEIRFLCNTDEEIDERHSLGLIHEEAAQADAVLTLECGRENGDIVSTRKAAYWYNLEVFGKASHAGVEPEKGRSAILELANKIIDLHALNGFRPGVTVNVGVIEGGTRPNVVAEHAKARFDMRAMTQADLEAVEAEVQKLLEKRTVPDVTFKYEKTEGNPPMEKTAAVAELVRMCKQAAQELGFSVNDATTGGGADGCFASAAGVPTLDGLGPVGGLDHGPDEYIELGSIVPRTAMLAKVIQQIGERGGKII